MSRDCAIIKNDIILFEIIGIEFVSSYISMRELLWKQLRPVRRGGGGGGKASRLKIFQ